MARVLVVSDSLRGLAPAVAALDASGHEVTWIDGLVPFRALAATHAPALAAADAIVMGRVMGTDAGALALAPRVRVLALHTSGCDNVDLAEATRRGIAVTTVRGVNAEHCAEFAIGLMLAVTRQIVRGDRAIRAGRWAADTQTSMDLCGATFAVLGLGLIGKAAVRRAAAFGMRIVAHTRTPDPAFGDAYGIEWATKDEALARGDVVGLFASLTPETRHMVAARELALMQRHAYLVNVARGELVDEAALAEALSARRIAGAGLDVFEREPLTDSPLFALANVVLTPHQAGLAESAKIAAATRAVRNALAVLAGQTPADAVNAAALASGAPA